MIKALFYMEIQFLFLPQKIYIKGPPFYFKAVHFN